jgi:hypothetical protein
LKDYLSKLFKSLNYFESRFLKLTIMKYGADKWWESKNIEKIIKHQGNENVLLVPSYSLYKACLDDIIEKKHEKYVNTNKRYFDLRAKRLLNYKTFLAFKELSKKTLTPEGVIDLCFCGSRIVKSYENEYIAFGCCISCKNYYVNHGKGRLNNYKLSCEHDFEQGKRRLEPILPLKNR